MDSIVQAVAHWAAHKPDSVAAIAENQQITYRQLWTEVNGFASYLCSLGLGKGERVIVKARPSLWYIVSCLGIHLAGCVHVPLEKTLGAEGLQSIALQLTASAVISDLDIQSDRYVTVNSTSVRKLAAIHSDGQGPSVFPRPEDLCDILFTTGTTGKPKGVMLSHRAVTAVAENVQHAIALSDDNVYLIPNPVNHAAALRNIYLCMLTGTTAVLLDGYTNVKRFFDYIRDYHVTSVYMPPAAVRMTILLAAKELAKYSKQLRFVFSSSAPFPESDKERLSELLPDTRLYNDYGCSEAGRACIIEYSSLKGRVGCVGKPTKNSHISIVDEDHEPIQSSKERPGLIVISGPTVMDGYFNDPELTAETLVDGAVYTNDTGYLDADGYLYVLGRRGDVINLGGLKLAPTEVEEAALRYPAVAECVCYAVQDRAGNTALKLNVVVRSGMQLDVAGLREHMAKSLEAFKVPKLIEKVNTIPKTANGKIDRKVLNDR